ncbi:hypothetical protein C8R46DRAFT_1286850, partial [Mycena filopes]
VDEYCSEIKPLLKAFIQQKAPSESWVPPEESPHFEFLKGLDIPLLHGGPDMLLHQLGSFSKQPKHRARVEAIFAPQGKDRHTLVLNTSGSGKTRLAIEGLCDSWGLYFTSLVDIQGHGSVDLQNTIHAIEKDKRFTPELPATASEPAEKMNRHVARARLTELIYTRLVILELFCQVGQELSQGPLPDEYKKYWLLLQLKPGRLAGDSLDIFAELSRRIRGSAEDDTIDDLLEPMMKRIRGIVASHRSSGTSFPLYCVVDEAQSAAGRCTGAFRSAAMPDLIRPILREIVAAWIQIIGLWLILAGTGMSKEVVMETMASAVVKNDDYTMHYDIGGFDDDTAQFDYMTGLMPEEFKNTSEAEKIFELAHYWLRGRFRFTAALMRELLLSGFTDCEAVFQQYINASTAPRDARARPIASPLKGFRPTGGKLDRWLAKLPPRTLFERVKMIISTFYLRNNIKVPLTDAEFEAVEYGFARFAAVDGAATVAPVPPHQKPIRIVLDEPLVVLALQQWLGENDISVHDGLSLRARLGVQEAGSKSNGLEEYFAFYLSTVFDNETPLTSIFRFHPKRVPVWANEPAKLISLYRRDAPWKDGDTRRLQSGRVLEAARPSVSLGMGATSKYVRIWMRHGIKTPFIFPDTGMGPDILFILELGDELRSRIWVAVQSKYSAASLLRREELEKALRSVTPSRFYLGQPKEAPETPEEIAERAKGQALHAGILPLLEALPGRLKYFPRQPKQSAGKYSLLRVVAGWKSRIELHERGDPSTKKKEPP